MSHLEPVSTDELPVFRSNQEKVGQNINRGRITRVSYLPVGKRVQLTGKQIPKILRNFNKTGKSCIQNYHKEK